MNLCGTRFAHLFADESHLEDEKEADRAATIALQCSCLIVVVMCSSAPAQGQPRLSDQAMDYHAVVDGATHGSSAGERLRRSATEFVLATQRFDRAVAARVSFDRARLEFGRVLTAWRHVLEALNAPEASPGQPLRNKTREIHATLDQIRVQMNLRDPFVPY